VRGCRVAGASCCAASSKAEWATERRKLYLSAGLGDNMRAATSMLVQARPDAADGARFGRDALHGVAGRTEQQQKDDDDPPSAAHPDAQPVARPLFLRQTLVHTCDERAIEEDLGEQHGPSVVHV